MREEYSSWHNHGLFLRAPVAEGVTFTSTRPTARGGQVNPALPRGRYFVELTWRPTVKSALTPSCASQP
jgi:hypothetical protein